MGLIVEEDSPTPIELGLLGIGVRNLDRTREVQSGSVVVWEGLEVLTSEDENVGGIGPHRTPEAGVLHDQLSEFAAACPPGFQPIKARLLRPLPVCREGKGATQIDLFLVGIQVQDSELDLPLRPGTLGQVGGSSAVQGLNKKIVTVTEDDG